MKALKCTLRLPSICTEHNLLWHHTASFVSRKLNQGKNVIISYTSEERSEVVTQIVPGSIHKKYPLAWFYHHQLLHTGRDP